MVAVAVDLTEAQENCSTQYARIASRPAKCRSSQHQVEMYAAEIASRNQKERNKHR